MKLKMSGLKGIVTGGSRGIGKAVMDNFVAEDMKLATCARGEASLAKAAESWAHSAHPVFTKPLDVTKQDDYEAWFEEAVVHLGGLDVLVSNVSTLESAPGEDSWRQRFEIDLMQHVKLTELALPHLKKSKAPSIVFVASIASVMAKISPTEVEYGAIKAALTSYAMKLANQVGEFNIRVNVVSPGPIVHPGGHWDIMKAKQQDYYNYVAALSVFNRLGTSQEVADPITFLSSPLASNITAVNLRIDGGTVKTVNF
jgi:NAD(P)-dependent dehydrogenase (short-subunit alcohol dehydrogenase family)